MESLFEAAVWVEDTCKKHKIRFCFIGGVAVQRWGEPRVTRDLDISVWTDFGGEKKIAELLLRIAAPRIQDALDFALKNRVLLLRTPTGVDIDASFAALPFEDEMLRRASVFEIKSGMNITTCSAEDLIVLKAFADRPRDWGDIESVLLRQPKLDWAYIQAALTPLTELKEQPEIVSKLFELKNAIE